MDNKPKPTAVQTLRRQLSQTTDLNLTSVHLPKHKGFKAFYRGADKSLARPGKETSSEAYQGRARDFNNIETRAVIELFSLQGNAPKEIHAILTETLACFLLGRSKDLSAPLYFVFF